MIDRGHTIFFTAVECDLVRKADARLTTLDAGDAPDAARRLRFYQSLTAVMAAELLHTADLEARRRARNNLMQTAKQTLEER